MTDVTNRTIAALLFVAMAVTVFSTAITLNKLNDTSEFGLTGFSTKNATARLNISQLNSIKFTTDVIDWENGMVNTSAGNTLCTLTTSGHSSPGYVGCIGFAETIPDDFVLENDGNVNVSVTVELTQPSTTWIGGNPGQVDTFIEVKNHQDNTITSCVGTWLGGSEGTEVVLTDVGDQIACSNFLFEDNNDLLNFSLRVAIPSDAPPGLKTVDVIATATPV
jgi:hypothetical protein